MPSSNRWSNSSPRSARSSKAPCRNCSRASGACRGSAGRGRRSISVQSARRTEGSQGSRSAILGMAKLAYAAAYIRACYPGLALRVSVGGRKSWNYVYRFAGKPRRMTLDAFPAMGVQQAHDAWRIAREQVRAGRDPGKPAPAEPATDFASVFREWIAKDQAGNHSRRDVESACSANCWSYGDRGRSTA